MERLTRRINGVVVYVGAKNPYSTGQIPCEVEPAGVREMMDRLAAYEDRGCAPEEVLPKDKADEIALKLMCLADLESLCSYTRLRELAEADKDGRLVVLPVKPVFTPILLYIIEDGDIYEDALYEAVVGMSGNGEMNVVYTTLSDQIIFEQADIGKTVFFTREEAKKALEGKRNA